MTIEPLRYGSFGARARPAGNARSIMDPSADRVVKLLARADSLRTQTYKGITTNGTPAPELFVLKTNGGDNFEARDAATRFLRSLTEENRRTVLHPIDAPQWQTWHNGTNFALRNGLLLEDLTEEQRQLALSLISASMSPQGYEAARTTMMLNDALAEVTQRWDELGEWVYWLSIFGTPSADAPWGWQLDGHHLALNCFILRDHLVLTPMFMGGEPNPADRGQFAGLRGFVEEEGRGLKLIRALDPSQRAQAVLYDSMLSTDLPPERNDPSDQRMWAGQLQDNRIMPFEGIAATHLRAEQQGLLLSLVEAYIARLPSRHAELKMDEVERYIGETHFAWIGGTDEDSVFYYKIQSPIVLVEFDHHNGAFLDNDEPERFHVHTMMRTPNGNDYGKSWLRQHLEGRGGF